MSIKRIEIRNFLGLKEVCVVPKDINIINGRNRQGKTSFIKAIEAAFSEGDQTAKIRHGESSAEILIELDDLYVQRSINLGDKSTLSVADQNGEIIKKPQSFLNGLVGGFSFNPAEFFQLDKKKQRQYLLESLPMTLTPQDVETWTGRSIPEEFSPASFARVHGLELLQRIAKWYYDQRTGVNKEVDRLLKAGQEQAKAVPPNFDLESFDENGLKRLYEEVRVAEMNTNRMATLEGKAADLNVTILKMEKELSIKRSDLGAVKAELATLQVMDVTDLEAQIAKHEETRHCAQAAEKLVELRASYTERRKEADALDTIVKYLNNDAVGLLAERVKFPVKGMNITDDGLLFGGKEYESLSGAEQIDVALSIAKSLNGKFGIICVDGVEKLDDETFKLFVQQMEADSAFQFFLTQVGDRASDNAAVFTMEDGMVKGAKSKRREPKA